MHHPTYDFRFFGCLLLAVAAGFVVAALSSEPVLVEMAVGLAPLGVAAFVIPRMLPAWRGSEKAKPWVFIYFASLSLLVTILAIMFGR
jgi:enoyl-CoA hydratase/carnithine racemase